MNNPTRNEAAWTPRIAFTPLLLLLSCVIAASIALSTTTSFDQNILNLLPSVFRDPITEAAVNLQAQGAATKVAVIVRSSSAQLAESSAVEIAQRMRESGLFSRVDERLSATTISQVRDAFLTTPFQLVDPPQTARDLFDQSLQVAFSPEGSIWLQHISKDPFLLQPEYFRSLTAKSLGATLRNGFIHVQSAGATNVLIHAVLADGDGYSRGKRTITHFFDQIPRTPGVTIIPAGMVFFAEDSAARAQNEMSIIGALTLFLIIATMLVIFRSLRPVLLTSACIVSSFLVSLYLSNLLWQFSYNAALHLITVGFGSSLLGVSSDYALHYFIALKTTPPPLKRTTFTHIRSGIFLGYVTSILGFLGIAVAPFPGLRQLSLFCCLGLTVSLLFTLLVLPGFTGKTPFDPRIVSWARYKVGIKTQGLALVGVLALATLGLPHLAVQDDIRALATPSETLLTQQREAAKLFGFSDGGTFLVVQGATYQEVLEREELVRDTLDQMIAERTLGSYRATSTVVPSIRTQNYRHHSFRSLLSDSEGALQDYFATVQAPQDARSLIEGLRSQPPAQLLEVSECISSPVCDSVRDLWVGNINNRIASLIALTGLSNKSLLTNLVAEGIKPVNQADTISAALRRYRVSATWYTSLFYIVIFFALLYRYGFRHALRVGIPTTLGSIAALSALGLMGVPINAFSVFALIVLLGISIDYAIFFAEDSELHDATSFSVLLSALTTTISFGLLIFSSTPALQSFGIVLGIGSITAAIFAPVAAKRFLYSAPTPPHPDLHERS